MSKQFKTRFSIRRKMLVGFLLLGILSSTAVGVFAYLTVSKYETNKLKEKLLMVSTMVSKSVDGDVHSKIKPGDEKTDTYKTMIQKLREFKKITGLTYLYTFVSYTDEKVKFILDSDDTDAQAYIGKEYDMDDCIKKALAGTAAVEDEAYTDEWGTFYSAFAPVYNSKNDIVAVVGADISVGDVQKIKQTLMLIIAGGVLFSILLSITLALFISSVISKPVTHLVKAMDDIARNSGDLTQKVRIKTGDELELLAESTNNLLSNIRSIVGIIRGTSLNINDNSKEIALSIENTSAVTDTIAKAMEDIAYNASEQLQNINDSSIKLQSLSEIINALSNSSKEIDDSVKEATKGANDCLKAVEDLKDKADLSTDILKSASKTAEMLQANSSKVGKVIDVITGISEQTNLLALNAAIEAARAGDQGRGFAVVADEIRKLAESTTRSAKEISQYANEIKNQSKGTSSAMDNIIGAVSGQMDSIRNTGSMLNNINSIVSRITGSLMEIESAVNKVYNDKQDIITLNNGIQLASEQMAATTEEINSSEEEQHAVIESISDRLRNLNDMADELNSAVDRFII